MGGFIVLVLHLLGALALGLALLVGLNALQFIINLF